MLNDFFPKGLVSLNRSAANNFEVHLSDREGETPIFAHSDMIYWIALLLKTGQIKQAIAAGTLPFSELANDLHASSPVELLLAGGFFLRAKSDADGFRIKDADDLLRNAGVKDAAAVEGAVADALSRGWVERMGADTLRLTASGLSAVDRGFSKDIPPEL